MATLLAALVFIAIAVLVVEVWRATRGARTVEGRLTGLSREREHEIAIVQDRSADGYWPDLLERSGVWQRVVDVVEQSGHSVSMRNVLVVMALFALVCGAVGGWRAGTVAWAVLSAMLGGSLPLFYFMYKRHQRLTVFEQQFPEALDTLSRSIRAGYSLGAGVQLVSDEMPDPVGGELKRVFEEIRLGRDPGDALARLWRRVPTDDVRFFCAAIGIQRKTGGNLAEMLDRLSEVIRERFKVLSHARAVSAQQRWGAIMIGLSPLGFGVVLRLGNPTYFDPLLESPLGSQLILAGLALEAVGFLVIWRIAKIKV
jgi:tight adherence protein B